MGGKGGAGFQTGILRPPAAHWHRLAHEVPPIIVLSWQPPPTRFSKKECVWSGPNKAGLQTRRTDSLSPTQGLSGHHLAQCRL